MTPASLTDVLTTTAPQIADADAEGLARRYFGVAGTARSLASERDQNFRLSAADGTTYVLKVANPAEDPAVTDFQTRALLHIAAVDPSLPVPRVRRALDGAAQVVVTIGEGDRRVVRLLSYLDGEPLPRQDRTAARRRSVGRCLAQLGLALRDFSHPAAGYELLWDLKHASRVRDLVPHIEAASGQALAHRVLDRFEAHALPAMPGLRAQVIHNDFNPTNVLVDPADRDRVVGVIDFGDMVQAPLIHDLAVASAYQLAADVDPLTAVAELAAAYHAVVPLRPVEIALLFDLIATRLVMSVAISGWRAVRYRENRDYILRNSPAAWAALDKVAAIPRDVARETLERYLSNPVSE
ncbi:MAG TPA: phosphotransferase [Stellaceae bacterium]|nr:phosphotransferase [Stellaceae bacterium]